MRRSFVPLLKAMDRAVIVLTARDATAEKVAALDLGADDYVVKPFDTDELLARIRTALRHRSGAPSDGLVLTNGSVVIDLAARRVCRDGTDVRLTRKEYAVLAELARNPDRVLTHSALLRAVWGEAHLDDVEYLRVAMRGLRLKLEDDPAAPTLFRNEPGVGYRLASGVDEDRAARLGQLDESRSTLIDIDIMDSDLLASLRGGRSKAGGRARKAKTSE